MEITSLENEKIKKLSKLKDKKYRDLENKFLVEGLHLVNEAKNANLLEEVLIVKDSDIKLDFDCEITYISENISKELSTLTTPSNIFGLCHKKKEEKNLGNRILILDRIQDPGNIGTIIRSSKAFGVDSLVLGTGSCDLYNEKVIRATQGIGFSMNIVNKDLLEVINELKNKKIPILGTRVDNGTDIKSLGKLDKYALIMGNEGQGVSDEILKLCDKYIYIKTHDNVESLNVSIATSILLYELDRGD